MTTGGWIFLIGGWGSIIYLTVFCFIRVFASDKKDNTTVKEKNYENGKPG